MFSYSDWYLKDGKPDFARVLQGWVEKEKNALKNGFEGLRLSGNTFWVESSLWQSFVDYEEAVNSVLSGHKMLALCTNCLTNCSGRDVLDVVRNHKGTLVKRGDKWVLVEDVLHRKKVEESVAKQAELIDLSPDAIIVRKLNGIITFWSKGAENLYGWSKDEAIGQDIDSLIKPEFSQPFEEILNKIKQEGKWSGEFFDTCKNGGKVAVQSYWLAKFGADCKIVELLESNVDITERVKLQVKLQESALRVKEHANQMEELANQRAAQLKDAERLAAIGAIAGMVGHDLRNPLQSITGEVYLAKEELKALSESEQKTSLQESIEIIADQINYMDKIVSDLHAFVTPVEAHKQMVEVKQLVIAVLEQISIPQNIERLIHLQHDLVVSVDPELLKRVIINLVTNAVQAMPNGGDLSVKTEISNAGEVQIIVGDTGVGISDDVKPKIFTPLFTTKAKGQGFGLAVCKRVMEAQGGKVTFESQLGKGTTFIVRLPQQKT